MKWLMKELKRTLAQLNGSEKALLIIISTLALLCYLFDI